MFAILGWQLLDNQPLLSPRYRVFFLMETCLGVDAKQLHWNFPPPRYSWGINWAELLWDWVNREWSQIALKHSIAGNWGMKLVFDSFCYCLYSGPSATNNLQLIDFTVTQIQQKRTVNHPCPYYIKYN